MKKERKQREDGYVQITVFDDNDVILGYEVEHEGKIIGRCSSIGEVENTINDHKPKPPGPSPF